MAIRFDSSGKSLTDDIGPIGTQTSLSFWFNLTDVSGTRRLFGSTNTWEVRMSGSTLLNEFYQDTSTTSRWTGLTTGVWRHVVCVANQSGFNADYGNGALIDSRSGNMGNPGTPTRVRVGSSHWNSGQNARAIMEDVRLYDRVLTPDEILILYNSEGQDYITEGLIRWWPLEEESSGTATDVKELMATSPNVAINGSPQYDEGVISL